MCLFVTLTDKCCFHFCVFCQTEIARRQIIHALCSGTDFLRRTALHIFQEGLCVLKLRWRISLSLL